LHARVDTTAVRCRLAAFATLRASAESIGQWRKQPIRLGADAMPATFLKHADNQTVVAVAAVSAVIERQGWHECSFADWGVLAAPNRFGRISVAQTIERLRAEGAWGVSPHLIPHQSLHAVSGTISQALKIHGPNFGVSGGPNAGPDAFLLAIAMLADGGLPGLWLILTGYEQEWIPAPNQTTAAPPCLGAALALVLPSPPATKNNAVSTNLAAGGEGPGVRGDFVGHAPTNPPHPRPLSPGHAPFRQDEITAGRGRGENGARLSIGQALNLFDVAHLPEFQLASFIDDLPSGAGKWRLSNTFWLELDAEAQG